MVSHIFVKRLRQFTYNIISSSTMSISVLEGSSAPLDLPTKYQKLASEYAKIRAQFGVLKKAVVDEQNQSAELKEILRTKNQSLRKAEQELDSLNFRNQQLTKRVTILQDELDAAQNNSKHKSKTSVREPRNSVIVEELEKKIEENAKLISTIHDQTEIYENEKFKLNQKIEVYEHKLKEYETNISIIESTKLKKYENDTKLLLSKLDAKDEEIKILSNEIKQLKIDFIGRGAAVDNVSLKEKLSKLIQSLSLEDVLTSLSQFFQQVECWCNKNLDDQQYAMLVEVNQKNRLMLQDFVDKYLLLSNVEVDQDFLSGSESLCDNIQGYISVLEEFGKCLNGNKSEETILIIIEVVSNIRQSWTQFNSALRKLQSKDLSTAESEELVNCFSDVFRSFRGTCNYFLSIFNEKFKLHSTDKELEKEILGILSKMSFQSSGVYKNLTENTLVLSQVLENHIFKAKQKAALSQTEQCCEHWKNEIEILKASYSKKIKDLEEQISCLSEATTPRSTNSGHMVQSPVEEKPNQFDDDAAVDAPAAREAEYQKFFNIRANKLVADRQFAESKVTVLKEECEALERRLAHSLETRLLLEDSLKQTQNTAIRLKEELQTTSINYEIQLQSMSEHMANMNERLASQQEEIDILRHELIEKGMRKGK